MPQPSFLPPSRPDLSPPVPVAPQPASEGAGDAKDSFPAVLAAHGATSRDTVAGNGPGSPARDDANSKPAAKAVGPEQSVPKDGNSKMDAKAAKEGKTAGKAAIDGKTLPHVTVPHGAAVKAGTPPAGTAVMTAPPPAGTAVKAAAPLVQRQPPDPIKLSVARQNMPLGPTVATIVEPGTVRAQIQPDKKSPGAGFTRIAKPGSKGVSLPGSVAASAGSALGDQTNIVVSTSLKDLVDKSGASKEPPAKEILPNLSLSTTHLGAELAAASDLVRPAPAGLASGSPAAAPASANPSAMLQINPSINQAGWDQALGNSMIWMVGRQIQTAQLQLNPPHLGPIEVRVAIRNDQTTLTFVSAHSQVRDALQAAIPGLREMFSNNGLNLVNVDISQHSFSRDSRQSDYPSPRRDGQNLPEDDVAMAPAAAHVGLIDFYA